MAALSAREASLNAFFALFAPLDGYVTKARLANWLIDWRELPVLVQMDGGDSNVGGDDASSGYGGIMRLGIPVTVLAGVRATSEAALAPLLSSARAGIRSAVGSALRTDCTLGGLIDNIRYEGSEDPVRDPTPGAPPHGIFAINYTILMTENEFDPYSAQ